MTADPRRPARFLFRDRPPGRLTPPRVAPCDCRRVDGRPCPRCNGAGVAVSQGPRKPA